ncbi:AGE family epimerase/isomerase (plasmid) [Embleya sp. NBC_00888]|uniref:AGE family epimerase/isomerase n=1 Tax=Embleya sp. NBC_00888 TaxID=2975960 RepID=UPI002F90FC68|nr:AGE family epimerase/isomerase [Embleya sp. NBC_00888]
MTDDAEYPRPEPAAHKPPCPVVGDPAWLAAEQARLLDFARGARVPDGFGWLDDRGAVRDDGCVHTWITCRMTHVFALARLCGDRDAADLVDHGLAALSGPLYDREHGGWYTGVDGDGRPLSAEKSAYTHAFVVLAAAGATAAGRPGARDLLTRSLDTIERHFWSEAEGRLVESWDLPWQLCENYRGANANMHAVEAFLAAGDVTGEPVWHARALRIARHVVHEHARAARWRLVEHFDAHWTPQYEYNRNRPDDPFRPFGSTIGHWFEWARLLLGLHAGMATPPDWLLHDAEALFAAGVREGWNVDGEPGFVYTVDRAGEPVVRARMHWVLTEAIAAAAVLHRVTGNADYQYWYRTWWTHADEVFIDRAHGSWHHELTPENTPAATVWPGKPDVYHTVQATLIPRLPTAPAMAEALRRTIP